MIHARAPQDTGEISFLLNLSQVDSLGEMTAPPHSEVSVEPLLALLDDTGRDMWVRKEALKWLRRLKADFEYDHAKSDSRAFQDWWASIKGRHHPRGGWSTEDPDGSRRSRKEWGLSSALLPQAQPRYDFVYRPVPEE